jgi:hypothetical protein
MDQSKGAAKAHAGDHRANLEPPISPLRYGFARGYIA